MIKIKKYKRKFKGIWNKPVIKKLKTYRIKRGKIKVTNSLT